jgi:hypothetical protein
MTVGAETADRVRQTADKNERNGGDGDNRLKPATSPTE